MTKLVTKTIVNETVAVTIPGTERFVLVYSRTTTGKIETTQHVMEAKAYAKAKSPDDIKEYGFKVLHLKDSAYKAFFHVFTVNQFEVMKNGGVYWNVDEKVKPLKFGEEIPDDRVVLGFCNGDYTVFDLNEKLINKAVVDFYLDRDYDIRAMLENEKDNSSVFFISETKYRPEDFIYYVRGNGYTLNVGLRLSDEDYPVWRSLDMWERSKWLDENTVLGKYKRPEQLRDYDD